MQSDLGRAFGRVADGAKTSDEGAVEDGLGFAREFLALGGAAGLAELQVGSGASVVAILDSFEESEDGTSRRRAAERIGGSGGCGARGIGEGLQNFLRAELCAGGEREKKRERGQQGSAKVRHSDVHGMKGSFYRRRRQQGWS